MNEQTRFFTLDMVARGYSILINVCSNIVIVFSWFDTNIYQYFRFAGSCF